MESFYDWLVKKYAMKRTYLTYNQLKKKTFSVEKVAIIATIVALCLALQ
jgi:hypothetical protein